MSEREPIHVVEFSQDDYAVNSEREALEVLAELEEMAPEFAPDMVIYVVKQ